MQAKRPYSAATAAEEGLHVLQHCLANREVSATAINDASSRSHLILLCDINTTANGISHTRRLCLVDLAGKLQPTVCTVFWSGLICPASLSVLSLVSCHAGARAGGVSCVAAFHAVPQCTLAWNVWGPALP